MERKGMYNFIPSKARIATDPDLLLSGGPAKKSHGNGPGKAQGEVSYECRKGHHKQCTKNHCPCECGHPPEE